MATAPTKGQKSQTPIKLGKMKVSLYDRVASLLISLLIFFSLAAVFLFVVWATNRVFARQEAVPVVLQDVGGGSPDGIAGESIEIESPNQDEIAEETDLEDEPELQETLAMVMDTIATREADLADPTLSDEMSSSRSGASSGDGRAPGLGSGDGAPGVPRAQRWEIRFADGATLQEYAKQLDFFGIELGAIGATSTVYYASKLASGKPAQRTGPGDQEQRLYMSWQGGSLRAADKALLSRAGIKTDGRLLVQFYPAETENLLLGLELAYKGRDQGEIRKTVFGVREAGGGYEFYVIDQSYL